MTPPKSPSICSSSSDCLYDFSIKDDAADLNDSRSFMAAAPQLRHFAPSRPVSTTSSTSSRSSASSLNSLSAKSAPLPVPALSINTNLSPYIPNGNKSTSDIQSVDSVTELLARIDFMTSATASTNCTRSSGELQLEKSQQLRVELEKNMSQLHTMYSAELDHNQQLSARICSEEEQISSLSAQIANAQKNIAYVAQQRIQLVDRLQKVEAHQREIRQQMENANIEAKKCSEDVTQLDNKMFGMERKMVRMQRHMRNQGSSVSAVQRVSSSESYGLRSSGAFSYSSGADTVYKKYESTKRNRLSTVFRKSAAA
ncbi:hypothetical protein GGI15_001753 [Coemansia interrupta]|uniref:Uncharacterized protein n=1 Tax=Coemansia interrupta TaxID=1126814 RepID=A0A9W8HLU6_9FUNG|nr:hypothetical protein GGI15_001753 [Coemansia interrupta]